MHYRKLSNKDWKAIEGKKTKWMERKTHIRKGPFDPNKFYFLYLPVFMLSFFEVPRGILKKIE
jgi:hypothetical protein